MDAVSEPEGFFSADSHVVEPGDLWATRMDKRFRDRAPRIVEQPGGDFVAIDGLMPFPVGLDGAMIDAKVNGVTIESPVGYSYGDVRPGAWDPAARLLDQDLDGIRAEVIYPGAFGSLITNHKDAEYQRECVRVYNDWLAEFCSAAPSRLIGAALLPMQGPVEWAVTEAERVAGMGLRSVMIPLIPGSGKYSDPDFKVFWDAVNDLGHVVAAHAGFGGGDPTATTLELGFGAGVIELRIGQVMRFFTQMLWSTIPQQYPDVQFVLVESSIAWIASVLAYSDHWWADHHAWIEPKLAEPPSFYFKRQFSATFEDERAGVLAREAIGVDRLMWGSDYPHTEGTFPRSREQIARDFAGVPKEDLDKMVSDNVQQLYAKAQVGTRHGS